MSVSQFSATVPWPAISHETREWPTGDPGATFGPLSRRDRMAVVRTYRPAVPAAIAALTPALPTQVATDAGEASAQIARFDAEMGAELAPFASILLRSESAASSRIENLTASARQIGLAELGASKRENAQMIVANTAAMQAAISLATSLDADSILVMHRVLMAHADPGAAGHWRTEPVWIGGSDLGPGGADYVAPHHELVPGAIDDLVRFMARDDIPLLTQIAISHAQFETIHPFTDGNGRTGRALVQAMLRGKGLTRNVTMPLSAGLLTRTDDYYAALDSYRDGEIAALVDLFAAASHRAVANGRELVTELRGLRERWNERVTLRSHARTWDVMDLLLRHPVVNAAVLSAELAIAAGHVRRHMDVLAEAGIVTETTVYRRGIYWSAMEVLAALDAFAERAQRRRRHG